MDSSKLLSRLVEIKVKSAQLNTEKKGNFYVRISVSEEQGLRTKLANCCSSDNYSPTWNQKFVFSVPENFISDEKSTVSFTLFKARKYIPDLVMGQASCDVSKIFPVEECKQSAAAADGDGGDVVVYVEPEIQEKETFEVRAELAGISIVKGCNNGGDQSTTTTAAAYEVGTLNVSISAWEKYYPYELNLNGRLNKSCCLSNKMGKLIMQRASIYSSFSSSQVGNLKPRNLAMEFEEFDVMMKQKLMKKQPKRYSALCFAY
ncbi:OLC1v1038468C1 [Oldenlandia corymbosa var. corymbosa]|uniref:OLC1v1038468C1 n=1 Tax=Oldenlandia corymbosa var. corymbosa TaxID=529605 RepID=A0AAV1CZV1_OLDCO|nr:OLC1v1038468C1 [Oldenlandia corymbosa var. corymbosa]